MKFVSNTGFLIGKQICGKLLKFDLDLRIPYLNYFLPGQKGVQFSSMSRKM